MKHRFLSTPMIVLLCGFVGGLAACDDNKGTLAEKSMRSAGGLPEDRFPTGVRGDSPAPTSFKDRDLALEKGWEKLAKKGDKPPSHGDTPSGVWVPDPPGYGKSDNKK